MITESDINTVLDKHISIIVNNILNALEHKPESIYLVGGYGRGEGSWFVNDGQLSPYNDYDLSVITDYPLSSEKTNSLRKRIAELVGIKWVDINYYSKKKLESLKKTVHNYDFLMSGRLIYGSDCLAKIRKFNKTEIGRHDILISYRTRLWTFLGSWDGPFRDLDISEARFFKNQMAKAVLAGCDMRLVCKHQYVTSYVKRASMICEQLGDNKEFRELVQWAITEKLRPSSSSLSSKEMEALYFKAKQFFISSLRYSWPNAYINLIKRNNPKWFFYTRTPLLLSYIYGMIKYHSIKTKKSFEIFMAMNSVFLANNKGRINAQYVMKANEILKKYGYITENKEWEDLHTIVADARNNI